MGLLDLSQFKKVKREHGQAEIDAAMKKASQKRMQAGILHDVKIIGVLEKSVKFNDTNPEWVQWMWEFENSAGETAVMGFMAPLGRQFDFLKKDGKPTAFPLNSFGKMCLALGITNGPDFSDRLAATDCDVLKDFVGFQCRLLLKWHPKKMHAMYDAEKQAFFVVDALDRLMSEEPFTLPAYEEGMKNEERYAEMVQWCADSGYSFELNPSPEIFAIDTIRNPLEQVGIGVKSPNVPTTKAPVAAKPAPSTAPAMRKPMPSMPSKPIVKPPPPTPEPVVDEEVEVEAGPEGYDPSEYDVTEA
jgi:hypothetical protein